jgi:hypothetical protein
MNRDMTRRNLLRALAVVGTGIATRVAAFVPEVNANGMKKSDSVRSYVSGTPPSLELLKSLAQDSFLNKALADYSNQGVNFDLNRLLVQSRRNDLQGRKLLGLTLPSAEINAASNFQEALTRKTSFTGLSLTLNEETQQVELIYSFWSNTTARTMNVGHALKGTLMNGVEQNNYSVDLSLLDETTEGVVVHNLGQEQLTFRRDVESGFGELESKGSSHINGKQPARGVETASCYRYNPQSWQCCFSVTGQQWCTTCQWGQNYPPGCHDYYVDCWGYWIQTCYNWSCPPPTLVCDSGWQTSYCNSC